MLKFYPEQVVRHWDKIGYAIERALPPIMDSRKAGERMNEVLEAILAGRLDVYIYVDYEDEKPIVYATIAVAILSPIIGSDKELLLYSLFGHRKIGEKLMFEGFGLLLKYAKSVGCTVITAYTNTEIMKEYAKGLSGSQSFTYIRFEI
jgi:hypothetical protein